MQDENLDNKDFIIVLCAVALGISVITIIRNIILFNLLFIIKDKTK